MYADYDRPIGPWPRGERQGPIHKTSAAELSGWVVHQDDEVIVLNKDGELPCHPSKDGPWSSLAGAVREHFGAEAAHLVHRLDRETSGAVVFARTAEVASQLQKAVQARRYRKWYAAILRGDMAEETRVDCPLGPDLLSPVAIKVKGVPAGKGQEAVSRFRPLWRAGGYTLVAVRTETGRKHQIRAHAQWLGLPLVGDKIYGPDPALFLEFIETGWTPHLAEILQMRRQALHCAALELQWKGGAQVFQAELPSDMKSFIFDRMGPISEEMLRRVLAQITEFD